VALTLAAARSRLSRDQAFKNMMEPAILNLRQGFFGRVVGYRTEAGGHPRARVRTASYSKCVPVDWSLGDEFNDAHYKEILGHVFLDPFLKNADWETVRLLRSTYDENDGRSWKGVSRDDWWHECVLRCVEREVGKNARWLCEEVFAAAKMAKEDPKEAERRRRQDKARRYGILRRSILSALDFGITKGDISDLFDQTVVESVMDA